MSAAVTGQYEIPEHQKDLVQRQARVLGCPDDSIQHIMECFKTVNFISVKCSFNIKKKIFITEIWFRIWKQFKRYV